MLVVVVVVGVVAVGLVGELPHPNATAAPAAAPMAPMSSRRLIFLLCISPSSEALHSAGLAEAEGFDRHRWQRWFRVDHETVALPWQFCAKSVNLQRRRSLPRLTATIPASFGPLLASNGCTVKD